MCTVYSISMSLFFFIVSFFSHDQTILLFCHWFICVERGDKMNREHFQFSPSRNNYNGKCLFEEKEKSQFDSFITNSEN